MTRKLWVAALTASTLLAAPALADDHEEAEPSFFDGEFSANVAITSDYRFRGISQTFGDVAVQGGFDWASDMFYVGVWGSSVDFNDAISNPFTGETVQDGTSAEVDLYFGFTPTVGDVGLDFGFIYYMYPEAPQGEYNLTCTGICPAIPPITIDIPDQNYIELFGAASYTAGIVDLGVSLTYSPEYYYETGDVFIPDLSASVPLGEAIMVGESEMSFSLHGNVSYLFFSDDDLAFDYGHYGVGVTATYYGIDFDVSYIDTFDLPGNDGSAVFTISKSF